jgi:uncharacterized membrane protein
MAQDLKEQAEDVVEEGKDKVSGNGNGPGGGDFAKKILLPAAAGAGTVAVTFAARKAPDFFRDQMSKLEDRSSDEVANMGKQAVGKLKDGSSGLTGKVAGTVAQKAMGGGGGGGGKNKKTRRLPIQRYTDVAVPVERAYDAWTEFEKFPEFMHRVLSVEEQDQDKIRWREKIWFSKREWEAEITDRRKNDRIAWKTTNGTNHVGIVSFHKLAPNLTRVMVTVDFHPTGIIEKMASGLRFAKRAVQSDLARFKAYVELDDAKSLEYAQGGGGKDDKKKQDDKAEQQDREPRASGNGSGDDDSKDSQELEEARKERAERRKQRAAA